MAGVQISGMRAVRAIELSVNRLLERRKRLVVAVSGGADSSVLLDAIARLRSPAHHIVVACVDHGTGKTATKATAAVVSKSDRLGLPAVSTRLSLVRHDEASLRAGRWEFLRHVSKSHDAPVATAHTLDDHIETVIMRLLRGASARGLAGLFAASHVERPLLEHTRAAIRSYATARQVTFVEDPSNASPVYFRNRIRLNLLPAIRNVSPTFEDEMLRISRDAAELRLRVDEVAKDFLSTNPPGTLLSMDLARVEQLTDASLHLLLPAVVARAGIALDRRGMHRLAQLVHARPGQRGQVSGRYEAVRSKRDLILTRLDRRGPGQLQLRSSGETTFGDFLFRAGPPAKLSGEKPDAWRIDIPKNVQPVVRQWHHGDRLTIDLKGGQRRVKRFFADAGVIGPLRTGWPVVLCDGDVVWIPGIKASQDAVKAEGRIVRYTCERIRD